MPSPQGADRLTEGFSKVGYGFINVTHKLTERGIRAKVATEQGYGERTSIPP